MTKLQKLPKVVSFDFTKHLPQSSAEKTSDLFFVLSVLYIANRGEKELTKLTLEKTLFRATQILFDQNHSFLNTFFFINTLGPHNNIFYKYLEELETANLLEVEERAVHLTARGLRVTSELLEEASQVENLRKVIVILGEKVNKYSSDPGLSIDETHSQKVIDTTDGNKLKTIDQLVKEINPEQQFKEASQFKYIEPAVQKRVKKIRLPSRIINKLEAILASVEVPLDYEVSGGLSYLFA